MWRSQDFKPSEPRQAKGGIKAQSKRGEFGTNWWAKRWIGVLESFHIGARLARGRSYARKGQVLSIGIEAGWVRAKVQGSRTKPYEIAIQCKTLSDNDWSKLAQVLSRQALHVAKLLAGEMPQDIEEVFQEAGLSLFPSQLGDLSTKCTCPDWSNPCKHIAAVYYLLGEEFDRDPFLIFALRGMQRDALFALLDRVAGLDGLRLSSRDLEPAVLAPEPLSADLASFWGAGAPKDGALLGAVEIPPVAAPLLRRLSGFPFWRGTTPLLEAIEPTYARASPRGLDLVVNQKPADAGAADISSPRSSG